MTTTHTDRSEYVRSKFNDLGWGGKHKGERKMLIELLGADEGIAAMIGGDFGPDLGDAGKFLKHGSLHKGIIVATTERLLFLDKGIVSRETAQMVYENIESIADSAGMFRAGVKITGRGSASYQIQNADKKQVAPFVSAVRAQLDAARGRAGSGAGAGTGVAGELDSLYQLVQRGIISEADFEARKRNLLGT